MINFKIQTLDQVTSGLTFEFSLSSKINSPNSIYLSEDAFGLMEGIMWHRVKEYSRAYSHWGISQILKSEWQWVYDDLHLLKRHIQDAHQFEYLSDFLFDFKWIQKDVLTDLTVRYALYKAQLLAMLDDFMHWMNNKISQYGGVYIIGI